MTVFKALCRQNLISFPQYVVFSQMTISDRKPKCAAVCPAVKECQNAGQVTFKLAASLFFYSRGFIKSAFLPPFQPTCCLVKDFINSAV